MLHGIAHITGGGIEENLDRILPKNVNAQIDPKSWTPSPVFGWLQSRGEIDTSEMRRVFNMGIGMAIVVNDYYASSIASQMTSLGIDCQKIGSITTGVGKVDYTDS